MQIKTIRSAYKSYYGDGRSLSRADVQGYADAAKLYLKTSHPGHSGLCFFASRVDSLPVSAYSFWTVLSLIRGSVAHEWAQLYREAGRTPERIEMVKSLIVELETAIEKDKRKR